MTASLPRRSASAPSLLAFGALLLGACFPAEPPATAAPAAAKQPACGDVPRTGHPREDLAALIASCGRTVPVTPAEVRKNAKQNAPDRFVFEVTEPGHCYRVFAAGDGGIQTLAVRVHDESGRELVQSSALGTFTIVPERALLCLPDPGVYYVDIAVLAGQGDYALQIRAAEATP